MALTYWLHILDIKVIVTVFEALLIRSRWNKRGIEGRMAVCLCTAGKLVFMFS